jgi:alkaline phosphatase
MRRLLGLLLILLGPASFAADDPIRAMQSRYVAEKDVKQPRAYHFGSQGPNDVFSNHTSHSNRLIPVYTFGRKADLGAVTGENSRYRDAARIEELYGDLPPNTLNPDAEYADQSDLYRVQQEAAERGAKYIFTVWFDGMDWEATRAAAIARTGKVYSEGKGSGLIFQDYDADGTAAFGFVVTSPTHDRATLDVDAQSVAFGDGVLRGGYDPLLAGSNPWTPGKLDAPGYLKGSGTKGNERDLAGLKATGRHLHAYTDSSCSAAEYATGVKSYNNGVNVDPEGRVVPTLFQQLQVLGWKVGTVTSVPFNHASPSAMYAHNVYRDDYQDLAREMLGLPSIIQERGLGPKLPGLDVVIGTGSGVEASESALAKQGKNGVPGPLFLAADDRRAIDADHGGPYVVAETAPGVQGSRALRAAAARAAREGKRLFGFYGRAGLDHLPFRTADGRFDPTPGIRGRAETYTPADLFEQPSLADMVEAAITVMAAEPGRPFALFVEAGDVDFGLHDNNLDNAIGAVHSGEAAIRVIFDWVERHSDWDESVVIVTSDHGHYLVLDDPAALAPSRGE